MERAICERCGERQPADWAPGHLCIACGSAVRAEVRCAWCAAWIPAVRYCRACGCEIVGPEQYGAARMLKSAGVDRFSLIQRLRELDPEQALNLTRIYNAQLATVARCVDEVRLCEKYLLQRGFSAALEEDLIPRLPLEADRLAAYATGPECSSASPAGTLIQIIERSPIPFTRALAAIGLLRLGSYPPAYAEAANAVRCDDPALALEAALAFAHWRARLHPSDLKVDRWRLAVLAGAVPCGSPLRPWAAASIALAWFGPYGIVPDAFDHLSARPSGAPRDAQPPEWVRAELLSGLAAHDPDLRLTCAMVLGEDGVIAPLLASRDVEQRVVARHCLARHNSPAVGPVLLESSEDIQREILDELQSPAPPGLIEPLLQTALHSTPSTRAMCLWLLLPGLTEDIVRRILRVALAEGDQEVFRLLLKADRLPAAREVIRALVKGASPLLPDAAAQIDFADEELLRLASNGGAAVEGLVSAAEVKIAGESSSGSRQARDTGRFLARIAFGAFPGELRERAFSDLLYRGGWDLFSPAGIEELFGERKRFAQAMLEGLEQSGPSELLRRLLEQLSERWTDIAPAFSEGAAIAQRFAERIAELAGGGASSVPCREQAVKLLTAATLTDPKIYLARLVGLLRDRGLEYELRGVPGLLLAGYEGMRPLLVREPKTASGLADALAVMCAAGGPGGCEPQAIGLLAKLVRDYPGTRRSIAKRLAPLLGDSEWCDATLKSALDDLAGVLAQDRNSGAQGDPQPKETPGPGPDLDHLVLLPSGPVQSLAEYVAFMTELGRSADAAAVMRDRGMDQQSFVNCVSSWSAILASDDRLAVRCAELMREQADGAT